MTGNTPNGYKEFILFFERGTAILRPDNKDLSKQFFYFEEKTATINAGAGANLTSAAQNQNPATKNDIDRWLRDASSGNGAIAITDQLWARIPGTLGENSENSGDTILN